MTTSSMNPKHVTFDNIDIMHSETYTYKRCNKKKISPLYTNELNLFKSLKSISNAKLELYNTDYCGNEQQIKYIQLIKQLSDVEENIKDMIVNDLSK